MTVKTQAVVLPPCYTESHPASSFSPLTNRGSCTWHTQVSTPLTPTSCLSSGIATCHSPSGFLALHTHKEAEIYYIISGKGLVHIDGEEYEVKGGSTVYIPGYAVHGIRCVGEEDLRWFYVFPTSAFGDVGYKFMDEEVEAEETAKEENCEVTKIVHLEGYDADGVVQLEEQESVQGTVEYEKEKARVTGGRKWWLMGTGWMQRTLRC